MKILVVFYSRTGITRNVAEIIAEELNCDREELQDRKDRSGITGYILSAWDALREKSVEIVEPEKDPSEYDMIIFGTPVWAANMTPAIRTYINMCKDNIGNYALFCTYGGSGSKKALFKMENLLTTKPVATLDITEQELNKGIYTNKLDEFIVNISNN